MQNSKIEWTDHTFNPWWGCQRVSPGCEHCYAETLAKRYGHKVWGPAKTTERRAMSDNYWKQPIKWNKQAEVEGVRRRVFCASMADVFEEHSQLVDQRVRLFDLISDTPSLDWLLLTKRPENVKPMLIAAGRGFQNLPPWVWIGTSCEDQRRADERIPHLLGIPARVRFLSCEPLLGPVDLSAWFVSCSACGERPNYEDTRWRIGYRGWEHACSIPQVGCFDSEPNNAGIHWVIAGGESGPGARPMRPDWARSLRDQCQAAGAAFHFKQWGEYRGYGTGVLTGFERLGKHRAGRLLDGREWNEVPHASR